MDAFRDGAESVGAMVDRIHRRDHREEHLRCADITRRFVSPNVLFAGLECKPVAWAAGGIMRNADEPSRHVSFVGVTRREVGGVRPTKTERNTEALRAAHGDIRAHFAWWLQKSEGKNI